MHCSGLSHSSMFGKNWIRPDGQRCAYSQPLECLQGHRGAVKNSCCAELMISFSHFIATSHRQHSRSGASIIIIITLRSISLLWLSFLMRRHSYSMQRYRLVFSIIVVTHDAALPASNFFFVTRPTPLHFAYTSHTTYIIMMNLMWCFLLRLLAS
jgi:hypothetical protein